MFTSWKLSITACRAIDAWVRYVWVHGSISLAAFWTKRLTVESHFGSVNGAQILTVNEGANEWDRAVTKGFEDKSIQARRMRSRSGSRSTVATNLFRR